VEIALVLLILAAAIYLFATEKFPIDLVAMMVLGALLVVGLVATSTGVINAQRWITPLEGISGFSNPAVITVGAMFVLSMGLQKTGVVRAIGRVMLRVGKFPFLLLAGIMIAICCVSAFLNNTAAVAIFLPLVLSVAARHKISPSKLLIPLSYASQFGGVCTLIGTSTNLLVSSISQHNGLGAFSMFEMGQLGLILVGAGIVYFLVAGQFLLPARRGEELTEAYQLGAYITELRVMSRSPLIGKTLAESKFGQAHDVTVLEIMRETSRIYFPLDEPIRVDDVLLVQGKVEDLMDLKTTLRLEIESEFKLRDETLEAGNLILVEAVVAARAGVAKQTLAELNFRQKYNAIVLAIQRRGERLREKLKSVRLEFGDALLLLAPRDTIAKLRADDDFIVLEAVDEPTLRRRKAPVALLIFACVVGLAAMGLMPIVVTSILGCIAMVVTRCITLDDAYEAIDWRVIFLLAGVLPLGMALERSGAAALVAGHSIAMVGELGPVAVLAIIYLLTAVLTEFMSNNASAVLLAPIAISMAVQLGVSPKPFLMAVTFAASTAFATPVGYQTNAMVYGPGGYKFTDYMYVGIPLICIFWGLSVYFIPVIWPFYGMPPGR
jgi:di/tricarboxylate transporter